MKPVSIQNKATEVITRCLDVIYSFLDEKDIPNAEFLFSNKKLYQNYQFERLDHIKETYEILRKVTPIEFNYRQNLDELIKIIFTKNQKNILFPFLIPSSELQYLNELTEKEIVTFYTKQFNMKIKAKREDQLINYIFRGNNWKVLQSIINTENYGSKVQKLYDYIESNYYPIKAYLFLNNYITYINSKKPIENDYLYIKLDL